MTSAARPTGRTGSRLRHLCIHDVRAHRARLVAWCLLVAAHPLLAVLPWPGSAGPRGALQAMLLPVLRMVLMAVIVAGLVQHDSPIDDRAFWRTRPVPARVLAASKGLVVCLGFLVWPAVVVAGIAWYFEVPWWYWPSMLAQIIVTDAATVGLVLVVATRTRHVATLLLTTATAVGTFVLLLNALERYRELPWIVERGLMADPQPALWANLFTVALAASALYFVGYRGRAARRPFAAGVFACVLLVVGAWFAPALRASRRGAPEVAVDLQGAEVWAESLTRAGTQVGLVVQPRVQGLRPTDVTDVSLLDGTLQTPAGPRVARLASQPHSVIGDAVRPQAPLLAVLDTATFQALAGRRVRFDGRLSVHVRHQDVVATASLEPGGSVSDERMRLTVTDVGPGRELAPWQSIARGVQVRLARPWSPASWAAELQLRDVSSGCVQMVFPQSVTPFHPGVVLPTLARPFTVAKVALTTPTAGCALAPARVVLQLLRRTSDAPVPVTVSLEFTVPRTVQPMRVLKPR